MNHTHNLGSCKSTGNVSSHGAGPSKPSTRTTPSRGFSPSASFASAHNTASSQGANTTSSQGSNTTSSQGSNPTSSSSSLSRRNFFLLAGGLTGALATVGALGAASTLSGCTSAITTATSVVSSGEKGVLGSPTISFSQSVDVLIVGSGIAGLSAAMDAAESGYSVLIAEKRDLLGGESYDAVGVLHLAGTDAQIQAGLETSATDAWNARLTEMAEEYGLTDISAHTNLADAQAQWADRVAQDYGAVFASIDDSYLAEAALQTVMLPKNGLGDMDSVMAPIKDQLINLGVSFTLGMRAVAFIVDENSTVCGMRLRSDSVGTVTDIQARKIVLATGGYCANQETVSANYADHAALGSLSIYSTGDGLSIGALAGGQSTDMDKPTLITSDIPQACAWGMIGPSLNVSASGARFAREDIPNRSAVECVSQELGYWWTIFDDQLSTGYCSRSVAYVASKNSKRLLGPFDDAEALAEAIGVPTETLASTLSAYKKATKENADADFGRSFGLGTLSAPYYALKQFPKRFKTLGGLSVTDSFALAGTTGGTISNVFCCGACAAGVPNGIAACAASGMLAGAALVEELVAEDEAAEAEAQETEEQEVEETDEVEAADEVDTAETETDTSAGNETEGEAEGAEDSSAAKA